MDTNKYSLRQPPKRTNSHHINTILPPTTNSPQASKRPILYLYGIIRNPNLQTLDSEMQTYIQQKLTNLLTKPHFITFC